jgi:hypothetical protein
VGSYCFPAGCCDIVGRGFVIDIEGDTILDNFILIFAQVGAGQITEVISCRQGCCTFVVCIAVQSTDLMATWWLWELRMVMIIIPFFLMAVFDLTVLYK